LFVPTFFFSPPCRSRSHGPSFWKSLSPPFLIVKKKWLGLDGNFCSDRVSRTLPPPPSLAAVSFPVLLSLLDPASSLHYTFSRYSFSRCMDDDFSSFRRSASRYSQAFLTVASTALPLHTRLRLNPSLLVFFPFCCPFFTALSSPSSRRSRRREVMFRPFLFHIGSFFLFSSQNLQDGILPPYFCLTPPASATRYRSLFGLSPFFLFLALFFCHLSFIVPLF